MNCCLSRKAIVATLTFKSHQTICYLVIEARVFNTAIDNSQKPVLLVTKSNNPSPMTDVAQQGTGDATEVVVAQTATPALQLAVTRAASEDLSSPIEVEKISRDSKDKVLPILARIRAQPQESTDEGAESIVVEVADDGEERVLTPEVQIALLIKLKTRFDANTERHEGVSWEDVKRSLEADPSSLWKLQQMEGAGHKPDVYKGDDGAYYFGTCSVETPDAHRNIVFDAEAREWLRTNRPEETCNGNAVDIAAAMGIDLMDEAQYRHLQTLGKFDYKTWSWLKTLDEMRKCSVAFYGVRNDELVNVYRYGADSRDYYGAFRGSLRVSKV
ncbi:MAG: hypothetical protein ACI9QC_000623 [Oceanicoccus sp.]|jgi:hypothetical protein